jgi:hypothetical protein
LTINELLYDAIKYDEELLAYSVYWSIKKGLCSGLDSAKRFRSDLVVSDEVKEMIAQNELDMRIVKLYSMPTTPGNHLIVLAESEASAKGQYMDDIGKLPQKIFDISDKMDKAFWFEDIGYKSIRKIKDETLMFPVTVMEYGKTN